MKYIRTYEVSRFLYKNFVKVDEILCVDVSKHCKVFTVGKKYDLYNHKEVVNLDVINMYQLFNDLGNVTTIWRDDNGDYFTSGNTALFSFSDTVEDYKLKKDASQYNL